MSTKSRVLSLVAVVVALAAVACADTSTAPQPKGARAPRDTMPVQGDTSQCRSGWVIISSRYVCLPDQT